MTNPVRISVILSLLVVFIWPVGVVNGKRYLEREVEQMIDDMMKKEEKDEEHNNDNNSNNGNTHFQKDY